MVAAALGSGDESDEARPGDGDGGNDEVARDVDGGESMVARWSVVVVVLGMVRFGGR